MYSQEKKESLLRKELTRALAKEIEKTDNLFVLPDKSNLETLTQQITEEIMREVNEFWGIEEAIDATQDHLFSTKEQSKLCSKIIKDCTKLKDMAYKTGMSTMAKELTSMSRQLESMQKRFNKYHRRRPRHDEFRKPQIEELGTQVLAILRRYLISNSATVTDKGESIAVQIMTSICTYVFNNYHSTPEANKNLISRLKHQTQ